MAHNLSEMLMAIGLLVVVRLVLSQRRVVASLRSSLLAAMIGSVVYPLLVYASTGMVAATSFSDKQGRPAFGFGFDNFGRSSPADSIPRGALTGVFVLACCDLARRRTRR